MKKRNLFTEILFSLVAILLAGVFFLYGYRSFYQSAYPVGYREIVYRESEANGIPPSLVFAVIRTESGFNPRAQSSVEARGLMQITEDTFAWTQYRLGVTQPLPFNDLYDSEINIRYGAALLRLLIEEFGTVENALCAYHAGWGNATRWLADRAYSSDGVHIDNIPFGDTSRYVAKVVETQRLYERLYENEDHLLKGLRTNG